MLEEQQSTFKGLVSCFQALINCFHANFIATMVCVLKTSLFPKSMPFLRKPKLVVFALASIKGKEFFVLLGGGIVWCFVVVVALVC